MTDRARRAFALDDALPLLEQTPRTLDAMLRGLPSGWSDANEGGESWSAFDVLGHLIHGERTDWMPRARMILEHGDSRPFDSFDRFAQFSAFAGKTLPDLLDEFARLRGANLADLKALGLQAADLDRPGRHPQLGAVTLRQLLATWVGPRPRSRHADRTRPGESVRRRGGTLARLSPDHQRHAGLSTFARAVSV